MINLGSFDLLEGVGWGISAFSCAKVYSYCAFIICLEHEFNIVVLLWSLIKRALRLWVVSDFDCFFHYFGMIFKHVNLLHSSLLNVMLIVLEYLTSTAATSLAFNCWLDCVKKLLVLTLVPPSKIVSNRLNIWTYSLIPVPHF